MELMRVVFRDYEHGRRPRSKMVAGSWDLLFFVVILVVILMAVLSKGA